MPNQKLLAGVSAALRSSILLLVFIVVILIFTAPGVCFTRYINGLQRGFEVCHSIYNYMSVTYWKDGVIFQQYRGQRVWGQLVVVVLALLFALPSLASSCVQFATKNSLFTPRLFLAAISFCVYLVLGALETWYATGFGFMTGIIRRLDICGALPGCEIVFVVKGWAVAAAFLFLAAVLSAIDLACILAGRD
ncbi:hypothetical protein AB6A40_002593 [Gnathostoma spinigerum]|uniref:Uncharacterized protein n=1 Tax=Gnathostoma spinigerum TaxID=75299 RepID=A0ABD6E705_9BILA